MTRIELMIHSNNDRVCKLPSIFSQWWQPDLSHGSEIHDGDTILFWTDTFMSFIIIYPFCVLQSGLQSRNCADISYSGSLSLMEDLCFSRFKYEGHWSNIVCNSEITHLSSHDDAIHSDSLLTTMLAHVSETLSFYLSAKWCTIFSPRYLSFVLHCSTASVCRWFEVVQ